MYNSSISQCAVLGRSSKSCRSTQLRYNASCIIHECGTNVAAKYGAQDSNSVEPVFYLSPAHHIESANF